MIVNGRSATVMVGVVAAVSGCGILAHGPQQRVRVTSVPPGATVSLDGRECVSPCVLTLARDRDYTVRIAMDGFQPRERKLRPVADRAVLLGNCMFFLCLPQIWERCSPSQYRLEPAEIDVTLDPLGWSPR